MPDTIPVIARTKGFRQMRDFYCWCREMRIPLLQCEVRVWNFEAHPISMTGSRQMLDRYDYLVRRRNESKKMVIRTAFLMRESDYALAALYHGGLQRGWREFVREYMYGDTGG